MKKADKIYEFIRDEENLISCDISYRGGNLSIDVTELFPKAAAKFGSLKMGAYQNYLGGGMAGAIVGGSDFDPGELTKKEREIFEIANEECKKLFYDINNGGGDDYMQEEVTGRDAGGYESNQRMAKSYPGL